MTFQEYLISKKIDTTSFKLNEPKLCAQFNFEFDQMHPKSFTAQKLFLINGIRRAHPLKDTDKVDAKAEGAIRTEKNKVSKPKIAVKRPVPKVIVSTKPKMSKPVIKRPKKE